jgi:hypothetical protein
MFNLLSRRSRHKVSSAPILTRREHLHDEIGGCAGRMYENVDVAPTLRPPMRYLEIVTRRYENGATHTVLSGRLGIGKTTEALAIAHRLRSNNHRADVRVNDDYKEDFPKFRSFHESQVEPLLAAGAHLIETKRTNDH